MRSPRIVWVRAILVALVSLAMPATAERGKQQQCKQEQSTPVCCCRVVAKGDHHPGGWTTEEEAYAVWKAMWMGSPNINKEYRLQRRVVHSSKRRPTRTH